MRVRGGRGEGAVSSTALEMALQLLNFLLSDVKGFFLLDSDEDWEMHFQACGTRLKGLKAKDKKKHNI